MGQVLFAKVHIVEEGTMVLCLYNVQSKRIEFELFFTKLETTLPVVVDIEALEEKDLQNFLTSLQKQTAKDMQAGIRKALDMKVAKVLKHECTKHDLANPSNRMFLLSYQDYPIECATWVSEGEAIDAASKAIRAYNRRVTLEEKKVVAAAKKAAVAAAQKEAAAEIRSKKQQQKEEKEAAAAVDKAAPKRITNDAGAARPKRRKKEEEKKEEEEPTMRKPGLRTQNRQQYDRDRRKKPAAKVAARSPVVKSANVRPSVSPAALAQLIADGVEAHLKKMQQMQPPPMQQLQQMQAQPAAMLFGSPPMGMGMPQMHQLMHTSSQGQTQMQPMAGTTEQHMGVFQMQQLQLQQMYAQMSAQQYAQRQ